MTLVSSGKVKQGGSVSRFGFWFMEKRSNNPNDLPIPPIKGDNDLFGGIISGVTDGFVICVIDNPACSCKSIMIDGLAFDCGIRSINNEVGFFSFTAYILNKQVFGCERWHKGPNYFAAEIVVDGLSWPCLRDTRSFSIQI